MTTGKTSYAHAHNQAELDRRVIRGLICEWEYACRQLPARDQSRLKPPLFRIAEMTGRLGQWSSEKREIALSRNLVQGHPWDAVREVLFHEMAHQFRDEVLGAVDEPPHGPAFLRACQVLRAHPKASGSYATLDERILQDASDEQDQIMNRIVKLMALAGSCNRHEAEAAMAKAHHLILKYNREHLVRQGECTSEPELAERLEGYASIFLGRPRLRHSLEHYHLANLLQDFYFVKGIWVSSYVLERGKMGRVLEISGSLKNVRIASYIYDCVERYIETEWQAYDGGGLLSRRRRTDFAIGILTGFRSTLQRTMVEDAPKSPGRSLIAVEDPCLERYVAFRYPRMTSFRRSANTVDPAVRGDGERIGRRLVIARGIERRDDGRGGLLSIVGG
jgi:hypothetical protein